MCKIMNISYTCNFRVHREGLDQLYSISYLLLGVIGLVNSIVSGTIVSFLTGNSFKSFKSDTLLPIETNVNNFHKF